MKLELKHLAPYLPYKLKLYWNSIDDTQEMWSDNISKVIELTNREDREDDRWKPILRPLSDLYTHKRQNGKTLPEIWKEADSMGDFFMEFDDITIKQIPTIQHRIVLHLIMHHYDVFNLIESGLAIDINHS